MPKSIIALVLLTASLQISCTQVVVRKSPCDNDKGIRYWRPKPYLFIGPAGSEQQQTTAKKKDDTEGFRGDDNTKTETSNYVKISMTIKYLPDYNEEYSIRMTPGLGIGKLDIALQDGWNLTTVGIQQDQQTAAILTSVAGLISAVHGGAPASNKNAGFTEIGSKPEVTQIFDASRDVPLGFYEPVIATDPYGRKSFFGWRYIGFMPFTGCPVDPYVQADPICCDANEMWGIYATNDALRFQRLSEMKDGLVGYEDRCMTKKRFKQTTAPIKEEGDACEPSNTERRCPDDCELPPPVPLSQNAPHKSPLSGGWPFKNASFNR